ncbi:unnamed protein product [Caenorhabditis angaria]|uniref:Uncharacterized protein n=1 Tax=Caenorhabditis angaria TaxID=860376 RepID=A0A9P1IDU2_9PELO|nr:unnamed protein product [Caenorhabditis angaria]
MKIGALLFFFSFFYIATAFVRPPPPPELHKNELLVYWSRVEKEFELDNKIIVLNINVEYADTFKIFKDQRDMVEDFFLNVTVHENDYEKMKRMCKESSEKLRQEVVTPFRHTHLIIHCESIQMKIHPHVVTIWVEALIILVLLSVLACNSDSQRKLRNAPVALQQYVRFQRGSVDMPDIIDLDRD